MSDQAILLAFYGTSAAATAETFGIMAEELAERYDLPVYCCYYAEKYLTDQPHMSLEHQISSMRAAGIQHIHAMLCFLSKGSTALRMREIIHEAAADFRCVSDYGPILESEELIEHLPQTLAESFGFSHSDQVLFVGHGSKTAADQDYQKVGKAFHDAGYTGVRITLIHTAQAETKGPDPDRDRPVHLIPFLLGCGAHARRDIFGGEGSIQKKLVQQGYSVINEPTGLLELPAVRSLLTKIVFNVRREENQLWGLY